MMPIKFFCSLALVPMMTDLTLIDFPSKDTSFAVLTSSGSNDWNTPPPYIELARATMGSIDVDVATNAFAQTWIQAAVTYDGSQPNKDGLIMPHFYPSRGLVNVFCNPPYGNLARPFCIRLLQQWDEIGRANGGQMVIIARGDNDGISMLLRECTLWLRSERVKFLPSPALEIELRAKHAERQKNKPINKRTEWKNSPVPGTHVIYFGHNPSYFLLMFEDLGLVFPPARNSRLLVNYSDYGKAYDMTEGEVRRAKEQKLHALMLAEESMKTINIMAENVTEELINHDD